MQVSHIDDLEIKMVHMVFVLNLLSQSFFLHLNISICLKVSDLHKGDYCCNFLITYYSLKLSMRK